MKAIVFNAQVCNGCYGCQLACKDEHCGNDWLPIAASQPDTGHFWCRIDEKTVGQTPKVRVNYTPLFCNHCDNAPCVSAFPDCVYKREDGFVIIDPVKAKGNKALMNVCPYGAIYWNDEIETAQKCTGCAHLLDEGEIPHCVDVCATGALSLVDEEEASDLLRDAVRLSSDEHGGRVFYLNMPQIFVSGGAYDPEVEEIVEGARVKLANDDVMRETHVDDLGDFWFEAVEPGVYTLTIEAEGYKIIRKTLSVNESLNAGDFPLERQ